MSAPPPPPRPPGDPLQPTEPLNAPVQPRPPVARPLAQPPVVERVAPPLPPEDPRWGNPWPAALMTGLVALLLGGVIGYAIGKNNSENTRTTASAPPVTQTVTNTSTVVHPKVVVRTVTANSVTQAPANPANEQRRVEAEAKVHKLETENEELRRQEGG
jgi:hypothetical protein